MTLYVWGVPTRRAGRALLLMASQRAALRSLPGVTFAKLLGTGSGRSFTVGDADINHWAALVVQRSDVSNGSGTPATSNAPNQDSHAVGKLAGADSLAAATSLDAAAPIQRWDAIADERLVVRMSPLASRGQWAGREPFGDPHPHRWDGPVAAITRARIRTRNLTGFWSSVPPVAEDLATRDGLRFSLGIGEAPIGLQGTFSIWDSNRAITEFAQRGQAHQHVMARTHETGWYAEELFARLAVTAIDGTFERRPVSAGVLESEEPPR